MSSAAVHENGRVLVIDDERIFREDLAALLRIRGYVCFTASNGAEGLKIAETEQPDVVLCDLVMPGMHGTEVIERLTACCPETSIIVVTAHATLETAIETFRNGIADYVSKPIIHEELYARLQCCLERRRADRELRYLRRQLSELSAGTTLVGVSPQIEEVRRLIAVVGPSPTSVLLTGESGTGKELVARALHDARGADKAPFIAVNCAALPRDLIESELFGHARGAFTGAHRDKPGMFSLAHRGTLFLDEIGELPMDLQAKLLRAIEQQEIHPVGATRPVRVDVRIIAATNRDLRAEIEHKSFREDLYFRLAVVEIFLVPLRDRREDIPHLCKHFLPRLNARLSRRVACVEPAALRALSAAPWRGNVRELENALERAVLLAASDCVTVADLPADISAAASTPAACENLREAVRLFEREHIHRMLRLTDGNREEAARRLGVDASTVYRRLKEDAGVAAGSESTPTLHACKT